MGPLEALLKRLEAILKSSCRLEVVFERVDVVVKRLKSEVDANTTLSPLVRETLPKPGGGGGGASLPPDYIKGLLRSDLDVLPSWADFGRFARAAHEGRREGRSDGQVERCRKGVSGHLLGQLRRA